MKPQARRLRSREPTGRTSSKTPQQPQLAPPVRAASATDAASAAAISMEILCRHGPREAAATSNSLRKSSTAHAPSSRGNSSGDLIIGPTMLERTRPSVVDADLSFAGCRSGRLGAVPV